MRSEQKGCGANVTFTLPRALGGVRCLGISWRCECEQIGEL